MHVTVEALIDAPIDRTFAALIDVARWPERIPGIRSVELLTGPEIAPGARFREHRKIHGREASEVMTVEHLDAPALFVLTAKSHGALYRATHRLEARGAATLLTLEFSAEPVTRMARLIAPFSRLFAWTLRAHLAGDLAALKLAIEKPAR